MYDVIVCKTRNKPSVLERFAMCVSAAPAEFTGATVYAGEVDNRTHVLCYQNKAKSLAGPNCMLLHVPTNELMAENLVNTQGADNFMRSMGNQVPSLRPKVQTRGGGFLGGDALIGASRGFEVVNYGAYEVVLADSAMLIEEALEQVSLAKRPTISSELLAWYDEFYPSFSFILACFNSLVEVADHPIMIRYEPQSPSSLFAPGLESHNGRPPNLGMRGHDRDFKVVFGSMLTLEGEGTRWNYGLRGDMHLAGAEGLLAKEIVGFHDENVGVNADYWASTEHVRLGVSGRRLFSTMPEHFYDSILDKSQHIC